MMLKRSPLTVKIINILKSIPAGKVVSYGWVARNAGNPKAARQVFRVLHTCSISDNLPWWRVVNSKGQVVLKIAADEQIDRLKAECAKFLTENRLELWDGEIDSE